MSISIVNWPAAFILRQSRLETLLVKDLKNFSEPIVARDHSFRHLLYGFIYLTLFLWIVIYQKGIDD
jgi:hypothetical protein